ncbi:phage tail tip protein, partial [Escherichia coli]
FNSADTATTLGTTSDPASVIPIIYGEQRTGTINVWKAVGVDTTYLVQVFAICEGEVDSFKNLYMDNQKILLDGTYRDGILDKGSIAAEYQNFVEVEFSTGKPYGHVFTLAQKYLGNDVAGWPDSATGNGIASVCVVVRNSNFISVENNA